MKIQVIIYVTNMDVSLAWYEHLFGVSPEVSGSHWSEFDVSGASVALHPGSHPAGPGNVELSLISGESLDAVAKRLSDAGIELHRDIVDEAFGRSLQVIDPDGTRIQVNEHTPAS